MKAIYEQLKRYPNVVGVGRGYRTTKGVRTNQIATVVNVSKKVPLHSLRSGEIIPAVIGETPTDVVQVGIVRALALTDRVRPLKLGYSVGHPAITAGTIGGVVSFNGKPAILSNNHVMANSNMAAIGDPILQPGPYDQGGVTTGDFRIGSLARFEEVVFLGGEIPTDCNIANAFSIMLNWLLKLSARKTRVFAYKLAAVGSNVIDAALAVLDDGVAWEPACAIRSISRSDLGDWVWKRGRTTEETRGTVDQVDVTIQVQYGEGKIALFTDQVLSESLKSAGGDSGSGIRSETDEFLLKGLLFAGSDTVTVWNQPDNVQAALGFSWA